MRADGRRNATRNAVRHFGISYRIRSWRLLLVGMLAAVGAPLIANAQSSTKADLEKGECKMEPEWSVAVGTAKVMPSVLRGVGIVQELDHQIPLNLPFRDSDGHAVTLGQYFGKKPVILSLVYFNCPMLCTLEEHGLLQALKLMRFTVGKQFNVVTVSFDPHDTPEIAAKKKRLYLSLYGRPAAAEGWHFLTGSQASIAALTDAVGFHYKPIVSTDTFAHAVAIIVATPAGKLAQYFYGIKYPAGNLRLALIQASHEQIGSSVDEMILYCYRYNPATGKYAVVIPHVVMLGGAATIAMLGGLILVLMRGGRRQRDARNA
jgi:protein SCO1